MAASAGADAHLQPLIVKITIFFSPDDATWCLYSLNAVPHQTPKMIWNFLQRRLLESPGIKEEVLHYIGLHCI